MFALLTGVSGAWADVTVTLSDQTDLGSITNKNQSEAATVHKYGTYASGTGGTTFTTNNTSGLEGLVVSTTGDFIKPTFYDGGKYKHCLAIKPADGYGTTYTVTITAPLGYYIKSYSMKAISTTSSGTFDVTPLGWANPSNISSDQKEINVTAFANTTSFTVKRIAGTTNNSELCLPFFTVTLASTTLSGDATLTINSTTGSGTRADGSAPSGTANFRTWTSTSSPTGLTLQTASGNDLNHNATEVIMHSAGGTYTLTAPDGYFIKGYKMEVYSSNRNTIQPAGANVKTELSGDSGNKTIICVDDINAKSTTFTRGYITSAAYANAVMTVYLKESTVKITYVVKNSGGTEIFRSEAIDTWPGTAITTLPSEFKRDFCSYNEVSETADVTKEINFTATWNFPFEISDTYAGAHWYDMSIRSTWYVTSDQTAGDGALQTVNANALGLATDPYQWAFVGNPYNLKLYNKDKGEDYVYAWTATTNASIPAFVDAATGNSWTIKRSTATGYTNAFMLTIPDYGYQVNQFNGEGGSLKVWADTRTTDAGSAFKVFDVPDDFAEYVTSEIAPYMESSATYFNWTDAARTAIGYDVSYKTTCTYAKYAAMKNALTTALGDLNSNVIFPEPGYYRIKNRLTTDSYGYIGLNGGTNLLGNISNTNDASTIIHLTKSGSKYYFQTQGKYTSNVRMDNAVSLVDATPSEAFDMQAQEIGYAAFRTWDDGPYSYYHASIDKGYNIVGWEHTAYASQWSIENVSSLEIPLNYVPAEGYSFATMCLPFDVTLPSYGQSGFVIPALVTVVGSRAQITTSIKNQIPAGTPVLLVATGELASTTATIATTALSDPITGDNDLVGTYFDKTSLETNEYVFATSGGELGFWKLGTGFKVGANKAFLSVPDGGSGNVKGYAISFDELVDGINAMDNGQLTKDNDKVIYNLAGQRINKLQRGVNIVNGKKVIIK